MRVLIIDDDSQSIQELASILGFLGHEPTSAGGAQEALRRFHETLPDLVFLSLGLGGQEPAATRLCAHLKRSDHGLITPVVLISGAGTESRLDAIRSHGAVDCILRPFQVEKIRTLLAWLTHPRDEEASVVADEELDRFTLSPETEGVVSLESGSLPYLLGRAEEDKLTGLLLLQRGPRKRALLLDGGLIVGARSNFPAERLDRILVAMRKLTPAQLESVRARMSSASADLFPILGFLGILPEGAEHEVLRYQAMSIGLASFAGTEGALQFLAGESLACHRFRKPIRPTWLALVGLRRHPHLLAIARQRFVRDPVRFERPPERDPVGLGPPLTRRERSVLRAVDGTRSVQELRELGELARLDLDEPLALLAGAGLIKPGSSPSLPARAEPQGSDRARAAAGTPSSGELAERPLVEILGALARVRATGILTLTGGTERSFEVLGGEIVFARSSDPRDSLGQILLASGLVDPAALARALSRQQGEPGRAVGSLLVEMGLLSFAALGNALRAQLLQIVDGSCEWVQGTCSFEPAPLTRDSGVRLGLDPVKLLRRGCTRIPLDYLRGRWTDGPADAYLVPLDREGDESALSALEGELLRLAREGRSVQSAPALGASPASLLRGVELLVAAGWVRVEMRARPAREAETSPAPGPGDTAPAPAAGPAPSSRTGPAARAPMGEESVTAFLSFLTDGLLRDRREGEKELRGVEKELRAACEEVGELRERVRALERENADLRAAAAADAAPARTWPADGARLRPRRSSRSEEPAPSPLDPVGVG